MARETAVVIAPGRGTYNAAELGYLSRLHGGGGEVARAVDDWRGRNDLPTVGALDGAARFSLTTHGKGVNAASLIYCSAMADFLAIDREKFDVVALTGNSMGWYLALAAGGGTELQGTGVELVLGMAALMDEHGQGGQLIYPRVDADWNDSEELRQRVDSLLADADGDLWISIDLGGSVVLAGTEQAVAKAEAGLPVVQSHFPMRLANHAAFHTPLLAPISSAAFKLLPIDIFSPPELPLIDGRGRIWQRWCDLGELRDYTLGHQVSNRYDFSCAIDVAIKEFAPERLILLGPGTTLGAPVLQQLMANRWLGISTKSDWLKRQEQDPFLLSMGVASQRAIAVGTVAA